jgi:hypothetical protein
MMTGICANCQLKALIEIVAPFTLLLGYQTGGQTSTGTLPADPQKRWRCFFVDEVDQVVAAGPPSEWGTADNYNYSRPFNAIDEVAVAITPRLPLHAS